MNSHDHEYYLRREQQERLNAERCDDHGARLVHIELANRYAAMVRQQPAVQQQAGSVQQQASPVRQQVGA